MTRDEILTMPAGREMDAAIAGEIIKGWDDRDGWIVEDVPSGRDYRWARIYAGRVQEYQHIAHYSDDIAAAWEVVEKMGFSVIDTSGDPEDETRYMAGEFDGYTDGGGTVDGYIAEWGYTGLAPTAPLAICRAALLAVMEKK